MKTKITYQLLYILIFTFISGSLFATQYSWVGAISTSWNDSHNWSPSTGYPSSSSDTVYIFSGTFVPTLDKSYTIGKFRFVSGSLDLKGDTLQISGDADFGGGSITGTAPNALQPAGGNAVFEGTSFTCEVHAVCGMIQLSGSSFSEKCYFEQNGSDEGDGVGGNYFSKKTVIVNSGSSSLYMARSYSNTFSDTVQFTNNSRKELMAAQIGSSAFNGNIYVNSTNDGGVSFGSGGSDTATLASGKKIFVGSDGFSKGTLLLENFVQAGTAAQNITLTDDAVINLVNAEFNGKFTVSAPSVLAAGSHFKDTVSVTQTGGIATDWSGKNIFDKTAVIKNRGDAVMQLAVGYGDIFNSDVTFITDSTGYLFPAYSDTTYIKGNLTATGSGIAYNRGTGTVRFSGDTSQTISGDHELVFNDLSMKKTGGTVTLQKNITVEGVLELIKGVIVSDTTNLLKMTSTADARGGSDSSFVEGAVLKTGNSSFVFPVGSYIHFRPLVMSAPSSSTDKFLAQYFDQGQIQGDSLDTTITEVSPCNNWLFLRKNGSSTVSISLPWDTSYCSVYDTTHMRLAFWNDTIWKDKGHGTFSGTAVSGKMTSAAAISQFGYFALATANPPYNCSSTYAITIPDNRNSSYYGSSLNSQTILVEGRFYVDADFAFYNCQYIKMMPDAKIIIESGNGLYIGQSRISPCGTHQWEYIKIKDHTSSLIMRESVLVGADSAVWSVDGGYYDIQGSYINRCHKGIMVDPYGSAHTGTITSSWIGCATTPGGPNGTNCFAPHSNARTYKGIDVVDVNSITFGTTTSPNQDVDFYYMDYGIYASNTTFNVYNCNFERMDDSGYGIYTKSPSSSSNSFVVGGSAGTSCNFTNCTEAIYGNYMNADIQYNTINSVTRGIHLLHSDHKTVFIFYNHIYYFTYGTYLNFCSKASVTVSSNYYNCDVNPPPNPFWLPYSSSNYGEKAIYVGNAVHDNCDLLISDNWITNSRVGIHAANIYKKTTQDKIFANNIMHQITHTDLLNTTPHHYGIRLSDCKGVDLGFDIVVRDISACPECYDGDEDSRIFGFDFDLSRYMLATRCTTQRMSTGFMMRNNCLGALINCCFKDTFYWGVFLGDINFNAATLSNQTFYPANTTSPTEDTWLDALTEDHRVNGNCNPIYWFYAAGSPGTGPYYPKPFGTTPETPAYTGTFHNDCPDPFVNLAWDRELLLGNVIRDSITYPDHVSEDNYMSKSFAYFTLNDDTMLLHYSNSDDSLYQAYYHKMDTTNIGKFKRVHNYIMADSLSAALSLVNSITDTNTIESYKKTTYSIYLNTIAQGDTLSSADIETLTPIAEDDVINGGEGVWFARAMLGTDNAISAERVVQHKSDHSNNLRIIYPNPAGNFINLSYAIGENDEANFDLMDIAGRVIRSYSCKRNTVIQQIDVSSVKSGIYFYRFIVNKCEIANGKLVLVK